MSDHPGYPDGKKVPAAGVVALDVSEVKRQRAEKWPDFHPEDFCHKCGRRNVCWFVAGPEWAEATDGMERGVLEILCPVCFVEAWEAATGTSSCWELRPSEATLTRRGESIRGWLYAERTDLEAIGAREIDSTLPGSQARVPVYGYARPMSEDTGASERCPAVQSDPDGLRRDLRCSLPAGHDGVHEPGAGPCECEPCVTCDQPTSNRCGDWCRECAGKPMCVPCENDHLLHDSVSGQ